jgi:cell division septal protein FtsQ
MRALGMRLVALVALGFISVGLLYAYDFVTTTKKLAITAVQVNGITRTNPADIERMLLDLKGQNIFRAPLESYERRLRMLPRIKDADLKVMFPSTIVCSITEREPVALVFANRFIEVDEEGMVLTEDAISSKLDLPIITGIPGDVLNQGAICKNVYLAEALRALQACKLLGGSFTGDISEIKAGPNGVSIVSLREGCIVMLGNAEFEKRLKKFFLLRDTIEKNDIETKVIDLRFEDQIVLRSTF